MGKIRFFLFMKNLKTIFNERYTAIKHNNNLTFLHYYK